MYVNHVPSNEVFSTYVFSLPLSSLSTPLFKTWVFLSSNTIFLQRSVPIYQDLLNDPSTDSCTATVQIKIDCKCMYQVIIIKFLLFLSLSPLSTCNPLSCSWCAVQNSCLPFTTNSTCCSNTGSLSSCFSVSCTPLSSPSMQCLYKPSIINPVP